MKYCSFDIETTGLSPYKDEIFSYCIGDEEGNVEVYRIDGDDRKENMKVLNNFFSNTTIAKVCHNYHFELAFMLRTGITIPEKTVWHDTMLISQLLRNLAPSHSLDALAWELCGYPRALDVKVKSMGKSLGGYQHIPERIMKPYQITDGERTMMLFKLWYDELCSNKLLHNDYLNEIALVKVTQRMEQHGIMVDRKESKKLLNWLEERLANIQNQAYFHLGEFVNFSSEIQVRKILYEQMGLPQIEFTDSGLLSTSKSLLVDFRDKYPSPIFNLILQHRSYIKGLAMIKSYLEHADDKGIIRTKINTNQARTGRESSSDPNLHNVSKSEVLLNPFPIPARRCFRTFPGHVLFFGDYAGIEMRLIIDSSGDETMKHILVKKGDVHAEAARLLYGKKFKGEKVLRNAAKNAHFAIPYGAGVGSVAHSLGLDIVDTQPGFDAYRKEHPLIAFFSYEIAKQVKDVGYVTTPFGRKLYVPEDKAYSGANYLIQGTAAGIIKRAQVRVDKYLEEKWNRDVEMFMSIHDELIFSFIRKLLPYSKKILGEISEIMCAMKEISVPLEVEYKRSTTNWENAKGIKL